MFDCGTNTLQLIEEIEAEIDLAYDIPDSLYIEWVNSLEQLLYSEIIKEQAEVELDYTGDKIVLGDLEVPSGQDKIRFEDIYAVYSVYGGKPRGSEEQLIKTTLTSGAAIFDGCYFKKEGDLYLNLKRTPPGLRIIYYVRPEPIVSGDERNIAVPLEFLPLVRAKVRGEAAKVANEDAVAAKWLNDYNVLVETLKTWAQDKEPQFGM